MNFWLEIGLLVVIAFAFGRTDGWLGTHLKNIGTKGPMRWAGRLLVAIAFAVVFVSIRNIVQS